jgi:hypothetical protein
MFKRSRRHDGPPSGAMTSGSTHLQICTVCHAEAVHPLEWGESGPVDWWMHLRCGECEGEREVTVTDAVAQRYGKHLDRAEREITLAARQLDAERMAQEVTVFAAALQRDLIDASDFAR